jgi:hypothetical protein
MLTFKDEWGTVKIPETGARIICPGCRKKLMGKNGYGKEDGRKSYKRPHWAHFAHQNDDCPEVKKLNKRIFDYLDNQLGPIVEKKEKKVLPIPQHPLPPAAISEPRTMAMFDPKTCEITEYVIIDRVEDMANMLCTNLYAKKHFFIFDVEAMPEVFGFNEKVSKFGKVYYTFYVDGAYFCLTMEKTNIVLWLKSKGLLHHVTKHYITGYFKANERRTSVEGFNRYLLEKFGRENAFPF